jgi:predicted nucleotidyltransferase
MSIGIIVFAWKDLAMKELILTMLTKVLESESFTYSAWLGGSTATAREDELSDTDLVVIADNPELIFQKIDESIKLVSPIKNKWRVEDSTKYHQCFYVLENSSETYYIDICVFSSLQPETYEEYFNKERHGTPFVLFDKKEILKKASLTPKTETPPVLDIENFRGKFEVLYRTFLKEAKRDKHIDAFAFYLKLVSMWVQLERNQFSPQKHDFNFRYLYTDLPPENASFVECLLKVSDLDTMLKNANCLRDKINHPGAMA